MRGNAKAPIKPMAQESQAGSVHTITFCAGEISPISLTAATQGRPLLAMRYAGILTGATTTAPTQQIGSVAAFERSAAGAHSGTRANAKLGAHTSLESSLVRNIEHCPS